MNLEDLAKQNLIDFDACLPQNSYDPYRKRNVLKASNEHDWPPFTPFSKAKDSRRLYNLKSRESQEKELFEREGHENDRHSLKLLLMKLKEAPSPKDSGRVMKLKTISEISSTDKVLVKRNKSIMIRLETENKIEPKCSLAITLMKRPATSESKPKSKLKNISESFRPNEQQRVRSLIK